MIVIIIDFGFCIRRSVELEKKYSHIARARDRTRDAVRAVGKTNTNSTAQSQSATGHPLQPSRSSTLYRSQDINSPLLFRSLGVTSVSEDSTGGTVWPVLPAGLRRVVFDRLSIRTTFPTLENVSILTNELFDNTN
jgi:hypothetical protein